ncbi:MAG TPA: sigma-54-dependent Fis family transcriptional regulator, partial [Chromatiaceae bacterium]|nr:sigma-54-dependent Fis family transcriptional regulator [Chromatiaceae bacterium]
ITATNVDLEQKVQDGSFREDLYYRLQVINIHLPPLRERKEDLMDLIQTLLGRINQELHSNVTHISKDVLSCMEAYQWPGNIRELENVLMKGVALSHGDTFTRELLPEQILGHSNDIIRRIAEKLLTDRSLKDMEKEHISRILEANNWHRGKACEVLGISRPRLRRMINEYGLVPPQGLGDSDEDED